MTSPITIGVINRQIDQLALLKHYVRKYDQHYLKRQVYLSPHPAELMLRNHV